MCMQRVRSRLEALLKRHGDRPTFPIGRWVRHARASRAHVHSALSSVTPAPDRFASHRFAFIGTDVSQLRVPWSGRLRNIFFAGPETAGRRHPRFAPTFTARPLLDARICRSTRDFNNRSNNKLFHRRSLAHLSLIIVIFNDRERT
jgi:hypothetical protein